jgi:hypothetical protein
VVGVGDAVGGGLLDVAFGGEDLVELGHGRRV